jgi:hypothetical protein
MTRTTNNQQPNFWQIISVLSQIIINFGVILVYIIGIIPSRYYALSWIAIFGIGVLLYSSSQSQRTIRYWLGINLLMAFLAYIPAFGWLALFFGIKLCLDDINYLWSFLDGNPPSSSFDINNNPGAKVEYIDSEVVVEVQPK